MAANQSRIESASRGSISALEPHSACLTPPSISPRMAKQLEVKGSPKRKNFHPLTCTVRTESKKTLINEINVNIIFMILQSTFTNLPTLVLS